MIIIQEIHQVIGVQELPFEDSYRDTYLPAVATDPDTRLLWFGWAPHGGGQGYEAATITAARDLGAWDRLVERGRYGDLAAWATSIEAMRYSMQVHVCEVENVVPVDFADLNSVPGTAGDHAPSVLRLDSLRSADPRGVLAALANAAASSASGMLAPAGCWASILGGLDRAPVHILYRIGSPDDLRDALGAADPLHQWSGSLTVAAGLDDEPMETRLLRTARWSPLV